eukprot:52241-Alexandrium_andersonii.AAC.1
MKVCHSLLVAGSASIALEKPVHAECLPSPFLHSVSSSCAQLSGGVERGVRRGRAPVRAPAGVAMWKQREAVVPGSRPATVLYWCR